MSVITVLAKLVRGGQRDFRPWREGEAATVVSCDRRTGKPSKDPVALSAWVAEVNDLYVTVRVGPASKASPYSFWAETGWDAWDSSSAAPWRLFHGRYRR